MPTNPGPLIGLPPCYCDPAQRTVVERDRIVSAELTRGPGMDTNTLYVYCTFDRRAVCDACGGLAGEP